MVRNLQFMVGATVNQNEVIKGNVVLNKDTQFTRNEKLAELFLNESLKDAKILSIKNIAKFTLFETTKSCILTHLGFTGWWIPQEAPEHRPRKFIHQLKEENIRLTIHTDKGLLKYLDPRLLGRNRIYPNKQEALESRHLKNMAPEADSVEGIQRLTETVPTTGRKIKDVILDQKTISGIGNYLACEILFDAKIHPGRTAKALSLGEQYILIQSIRDCIKKAEIEDSRDWWRVFQRAGQPCFRCGGIVIREDWKTRGTYLCPSCQIPPLNWKEPGKTNVKPPDQGESD
jgi:formamidopyrimidine-DNA glycosylase